ncbi:MAG: hypothetical protein LBT75_03240, partial [Bacilli bacterium]|nr:hypothetical protein [Bacilli bacterium]
MKFKKKRSLLFISISIGLLALFLFIKYLLPIDNKISNNVIVKNDEVTFKVDSKASLIMNLDTNQIIYQDNIDEALKVYSSSKILFLATIQEEMVKNKISFNKKIRIGKNINLINKNGNFSQSGIKTNEVYTIKELYYAIMMASGNDASIALAEDIFGSHEQAVKAMNSFIKRHGLNNSKVISTSGLDGEDLSKAGLKTNKGSNVLSIRDTIKLIKIIEKNYPEIIEAGQLQQVKIGQYNKKELYINNVNGMIEAYSHIKGIYGLKTGSNMEDYSNSIINLYLNNHQQHFLIIIYGAHDYQSMKKDTSQMINYLNSLKVTNLVDNIDLDIKFGFNKNKVNYQLAHDLLIYYPQNEDLAYYLENNNRHFNKFYNVKNKQIIGQIAFSN